MKKLFSYPHTFALEAGGEIKNLQVAYHTYGELNEAKDNVIWVCHALTANSDVFDWWSGVVGENEVINPEKYFIICANIIGSPYGSTCATDFEFPLVTIKDMVKAHILLRKYLNIESIHLLMGGSMGGYQVLEWALTEPEIIKNNFVIAGMATESPWGIAVHTTQRMAIEADPKKGLATARGIGMLMYRNFNTYAKTQTDSDVSKVNDFKAESYIRYQGEKLVNRFTPECYYALTRSMDSHNIARGRTKKVEDALKMISQKTLIIGISTDLLCTPETQQILSDNIPNNMFIEINSEYGHDGFLVEKEKISKALNIFLSDIK
jgi:homoserine O-acetyltransferase/O-succinyltransferase